MAVKLCLECLGEIGEKRLRYPKTKFCSTACNKKHFKKSLPSSAYPHLNTASVGALHELTVACDLIKLGLQVFRAISSSSDCDLAVLKGKRLIRFEVTTGYLTKDGRITFNKHKTENFDVMAVVSNLEIHYYPDNWNTA